MTTSKLRFLVILLASGVGWALGAAGTVLAAPGSAWREAGTFRVGLHKLTAVAAAPSGAILVAGDRTLLFLRDGKVEGSVLLPGPARCIGVAPDGRIYLGLDNFLSVHDAAGKPLARWPLPAGALVTSLAAGADAVYAADAGNKTVHVFTPAGRPASRIGSAKPSGDAPGILLPSACFDVALDPLGSLWLANTGRHSLENYARDGRLRSSWGEASTEPEGFCGCCNPAHFAILPDGRFVTCEKGIPRLKVYSQAGRLECVLAGPEQLNPGGPGLDVAVDRAGRILLLDPNAGLVRIYGKSTTRGAK